MLIKANSSGRRGSFTFPQPNLTYWSFLQLMSVNTTRPDLEIILGPLGNYSCLSVKFESRWSLSLVCEYGPKAHIHKLDSNSTSTRTKAHIHKLDSNSTSTRTYRISSYNYLTVQDYFEVRSSRIHRHECSWRKLQ